jgi:hypothetical protein
METKDGRFGSMIVYSVIFAIFLLLILFLIFLNSSDAAASLDEPASGEHNAQSEAAQSATPDPNRQSAFLFRSAHKLPKGEISMDILGFHALGVRWGAADRIQLNLGFRLIGMYAGTTVKIVETQNNFLQGSVLF